MCHAVFTDLRNRPFQCKHLDFPFSVPLWISSEQNGVRRYLASFKGKLRNNAARVAMAKLHHNDLDVIVVDSWLSSLALAFYSFLPLCFSVLLLRSSQDRLDDSHGYEELLYSSVFPLTHDHT